MPHSFREEIFALGMGGAYTAGAWRGSGLFYNPASLAYKRFHLNVPLRLEVGGIGGITQAQNVVSFYNDNEEKLRNLGSLPPSQVVILDDQMKELDGTGGVARVFPAVRLGWRNFGFQTYAIFNGAPQMDSGVFQPRIDLNGFTDLGAIAGYSRPFFYRTRRLDLRWYGGVALKVFGRWGINHGFTLSEATRGYEFYDELADAVDDRPEYGVGADIGMMIPLTHDRSASIGIVVQDAITYGQIRPEMSINVGAYWRVLSRIHLVADYRDVLNTADTKWPMHVHFGGEFDLTMLRLRAGAYQGYPTLGLGVNLWLLKVDIVYYSQERGERLGHLTETNVALELQVGLD
ncbi:MAG TPA: hypothetical protein ENN56_01090 [Firmicutes bacterium]|nr:hypothetical protein [Bacillota bacterium]